MSFWLALWSDLKLPGQPGDPPPKTHYHPLALPNSSTPKLLDWPGHIGAEARVFLTAAAVSKCDTVYKLSVCLASEELISLVILPEKLKLILTSLPLQPCVEI